MMMCTNHCWLTSANAWNPDSPAVGVNPSSPGFINLCAQSWSLTSLQPCNSRRSSTQESAHRAFLASTMPFSDCLMPPHTSEKLHCLQRGCTNTLSVTSTYLCNKVQEIHPRFVCFCVCQFEQRRQFKSYRIASIPSLKKTKEKKYIHTFRQTIKVGNATLKNFFELYLLHSWYSLLVAPSVIWNVIPHMTSALPERTHHGLREACSSKTRKTATTPKFKCVWSKLWP